MMRPRLHWVAAALAVLAVLAPATSTSAGLVAIGGVQALSPDAVSFQYDGTLGTLSAATAVTFRFADGLSLPTTDQAATLTLHATALSPAGAAGPTLLQPLDGGPNLLTILRDSDGANLLTMTFTGAIVGIDGTPNATVSGAVSGGQVVTYSSDFLDFSASSDRSYLLTLPGVSPALGLGAGGFLADFQSSASGSFSADLFKTAGGTVPEPSAAALLIGGLASVGLAWRERRRFASTA